MIALGVVVRPAPGGWHRIGLLVLVALIGLFELALRSTGEVERT
jgi:hypothetical protein